MKTVAMVSISLWWSSHCCCQEYKHKYLNVYECYNFHLVETAQLVTILIKIVPRRVLSSFVYKWLVGLMLANYRQSKGIFHPQGFVFTRSLCMKWRLSPVQSPSTVSGSEVLSAGQSNTNFLLWILNPLLVSTGISDSPALLRCL